MSAYLRSDGNTVWRKAAFVARQNRSIGRCSIPGFVVAGTTEPLVEETQEQRDDDMRRHEEFPRKGCAFHIPHADKASVCKEKAKGSAAGLFSCVCVCEKSLLLLCGVNERDINRSSSATQTAWMQHERADLDAAASM